MWNVWLGLGEELMVLLFEPVRNEPMEFCGVALFWICLQVIMSHRDGSQEATLSLWWRRTSVSGKNNASVCVHIGMHTRSHSKLTRLTTTEWLSLPYHLSGVSCPTEIQHWLWVQRPGAGLDASSGLVKECQFVRRAGLPPYPGPSCMAWTSGLLSSQISPRFHISLLEVIKS